MNQLKDFKISKGNPDVRGWEVLAGDGKTIGKVNDLLIDTDSNRARYLDVKLGDHILDVDRTMHVLVPIGYAILQADDDRVFVEKVKTAEVSNLPEYGHEPITPDYEDFLRQRFDSGYQAGQTGRTGQEQPGRTEGEQRQDDFYDHDLYDDEKFYSSRGERGGERAREAPPVQ